MVRLTTHILDTMHGVPAANVDVRLYAAGNARELVASTTTNDDGRTPHPLLDQDDIVAGPYELEFDIGAYFRARGAAVADPAFLDTVVIRFAVAEGENYHVPLLVSPWSYSTYRGS
jgi:5-hydroxyisourate hydrolase